MPRRSSAALLDLVALAPAPETWSTTLGDDPLRLEDVASLLCPRADRSTRLTLQHVLRELGLAIDGNKPDTVAAVLHDAQLVADAQQLIRARTPPAPSHLVVTASGSPELEALQREMQFIPLYQLVEDVVRGTTSTCWLGAPYWNVPALERLRPALTGLARRGGCINFVCQGGPIEDHDAVPVLRRLTSELVGEGGRARVWRFVATARAGRTVLIHAKFALRDSQSGYLGSANMTRQGFAEHFEIGVRLPAEETQHLTRLLEQFVDHGVLAHAGGSAAL